MALREIELMFEKKFTIVRNGWVLPDVTDWCIEKTWSIAELNELKCGLNATKSLLNNKDILSWRKHTTYTNKSGLVLNHIKKSVKPEFLTQAWLKFYEILESYDLFLVKPELRTLHLCEAPGAFIAALNHYLRCNFGDDVKWNWMANTLNPYYEEMSCHSVIVDDRLLLPTLEKWHFGSSNTGNIMDLQYLEDLESIMDAEGKMDLVTADGSIDCQDIPEEQELTVSRLHLAEAVTGICALKRGGSLVMKMFTFYECQSVCLMFLLNALFGKVHVFKPATSKSGNSEVYVVCLDYLGADAKLLDKLKKSAFCPTAERAIFCLKDIPTDFIQQLLMCCSLFKSFQEETIRRNLELYNNLTEDDIVDLEALRKGCALYFVVKYKLRSIKASQKLVCGSRVTQHLLMWALQDSKGIAGSLNERRQEKCSSWNEQLASLEHNIYKFANHVQCSGNSSISTYYIVQSLMKTSIESSKWILTGQPFKSVRSSKFCPILLISWWNKLVENAQILKTKSTEAVPWPFESLNYLRNTESCENNPVCFVSVCSGGRVNEHLLESLSMPLQPKQEILCHPLSEMITAELHGKQAFLHGCIHVLNIVQPGDTVVLRVMTMLTRFTVGVLYLMFSCFSSVCVIPSPETGEGFCSGPSYWWLCDYRCRDYVSRIKTHLEEIDDHLSSGRNDRMVLEVVPMQMLCQEPFYSFVCEQNTNFMIKTTLDLVRKEKEFLKSCYC